MKEIIHSAIAGLLPMVAGASMVLQEPETEPAAVMHGHDGQPSETNSANREWLSNHAAVLLLDDIKWTGIVIRSRPVPYSIQVPLHPLCAEAETDDTLSVHDTLDTTVMITSSPQFASGGQNCAISNGSIVID